MTGRCCRSPRNWPGHYPSGEANTLTAAGTDPNAPGVGRRPETLLATGPPAATASALLTHWVAAGANVKGPGAVTGGRTQIADATAFGQWDATQRLVENGAQSRRQVLGGQTERQCTIDYDSATVSNVCAILGR